MAAGLLILDEIEIPPEATPDLAAFRRWTQTAGFPKSGRIDFVAGNIEIDMSGEDLFAHGTPKAELVRSVLTEVRGRDLGYVFTDSTRVSCPAADLSAEPDVVFVSYDAIESGRVRLVPKSRGEVGRFIEIEGAPELVAEVVSDGSLRKDSIRLPRAYFAAGVSEFWLIDARRAALTFAVHRRGRSKFELVAVDAEGFQPSAVLGRSVRLDRTRDRLGAWRYELVLKGESA